MDRKYRLTKPSDFKRVRRNGRSYAHPLVILIAERKGDGASRWGVTTSRSLRRAVDRNRAKRRLRHALGPLSTGVAPGWDLVFIARPAILSAPWEQLQAAVKQLVERATRAESKERQ
jgi:ribonuclease P protein component